LVIVAIMVGSSEITFHGQSGLEMLGGNGPSDS